jgi:hypothetical protein
MIAGHRVVREPHSWQMIGYSPGVSKRLGVSDLPGQQHHVDVVARDEEPVHQILLVARSGPWSRRARGSFSANAQI